MKVLLLTSHIDVGGIGVYTVNLAKYLKKKGIDVAVVSGGGNLENILSKEGIRHIIMDIRTKSEFGLKVWKLVPSFVRFVKEEKFDVVHAQTRVTQVLACVTGCLTGVSFISTCHGFFKHARLGRKLFPCWGDKVIAISQKVQDHLLNDFNLPKEKTVQIYNGIETERFLNHKSGKNEKSVLTRTLGLEDGALIVGTVGRFSSVKGHKYLIDAFKKVIRQYDGKCQLLLVGDEGSEKKKLQELANESGVSANVFFESENRASLEEYLGLIDIFCLPSIQEGLGISLMEAMAAGCACVASDVGGVSELIEADINGLLVRSKNADALSDAIIRLAGDTDLRECLAMKAREKAQACFSIEDTAERTIRVYEDVMQERQGSACR
jgi:glycosyltransferase involved in cell wall biosynthesis